MATNNLSKRVEKAKKLSFSHNHYEPGRYGTWGREDDPERGTKYYHVELSHSETAVPTPDGDMDITVLQVKCQKNTGDIICNCPGNEHSTVCYHGLGALYQGFKSIGKLITFHETYKMACKMSDLDGKVAKVQSLQGPGFLWALVEDWPTIANNWYEVGTVPTLENRLRTDFRERVSLMRGAASDEGID